MAADQRESMSTAPTPSPPARPCCPSFGRCPWRTKAHQCTQTITWTVLDTGIQTTTLIRTRCPDPRWCEWSVFFGGGGSAGLLSPLWTDLDFSACVFIVFCVLGILFFLTRLLTMSLQQFSSLNMWIQTVDSGTLKINVCAWVYLFLAWEFPLKCPTNSLRILQINDCWISVIVVTFVLSTCQTQSKQVTVGIYQSNFEGAAGCSAELSCETHEQRLVKASLCCGYNTGSQL